MTIKEPDPPSISIGMPVYNGERYLGAALESLLAQSFQDFEIIICDNASTDRTAAIAADWASRDSRIRFYANEVNLGVERNFNRTFELSRGRYFRWAAHDDMVSRDYLSRCMAALEAAPDAVLCQSHVRIIDGEGGTLGIYDGGLPGTESHSIAERFSSLVLSRHLCTHIFGLMRSDALRRTGLHAEYYGSDRATLVELGLQGRFVHVPEPLFMNREHPLRVSRSVRAQLGSGKNSRRGPPIWMLYRDYWRTIGKHVANSRERARCYRILVQWWLTDWNIARLLVELIGSVCPRVYDWVHRLKLRFYGPMPQVPVRDRSSPAAEHAHRSNASPHRGLSERHPISRR